MYHYFISVKCFQPKEIQKFTAEDAAHGVHYQKKANGNILSCGIIAKKGADSLNVIFNNHIKHLKFLHMMVIVVFSLQLGYSSQGYNQNLEISKDIAFYVVYLANIMICRQISDILNSNPLPFCSALACEMQCSMAHCHKMNQMSKRNSLRAYGVFTAHNTSVNLYACNTVDIRQLTRCLCHYCVQYGRLL